ncbi:hypothetical protein [Streptomyces sp. NPDC059398]|uniref:hypothetical protein n=1 Tax=Streptomyces sp. NPDC059398 TaxID=3346820 RepID=UPI00368E0AB4
MAAKGHTDNARHEAGAAGGRYRRERHDPSGAVLAGTWALGNLLTLFLLGALASQHVGPEVHPPHLADWSAPDQEVTD